MESFSKFVSDLDALIWGVPMIVILLGTHIFMTIRTGFIQRYLFRGIKLSVTKDPDSSDGEISQFGALTTALAATIGTGNIVGVATAVISGGPGAVLWMWIIGVFGMASKYAETLISVKYRVQTKEGRMLGGAMYALERGLGKKWLAVLFAVFASVGAFGIGCMVQSNSISAAFQQNYGLPGWITGLFVSVSVAIVIIGGVKSITRVCEKLVPFMAIFYVVSCIIILVMNHHFVIPSIVLIVKSAFTLQAGTGGMFGFAVAKAVQFGCARGLFSNESAMGSAPLVAAAAKTKNPIRQSLVSMTGTFWDTVVICLLSGLTLVSSVLKYPELMTSGETSGVLTFEVFAQVPVIGRPLITLALGLFAFSTILGWSYYGEKAAEYLIGSKVMIYYKLCFVILTFVGSVVALDMVWAMADILNGLMVIPNVIAMIALSTVIASEGKRFINNIEDETDDEVPVIDK